VLNVALMAGGLIAFAISIWGKRFYDADVEGMPLRKEKEASQWSGKLIFGIVGIGLFIIGIVKLLAHQ